jgi:hypothetical protein
VDVSPAGESAHGLHEGGSPVVLTVGLRGRWLVAGAALVLAALSLVRWFGWSSAQREVSEQLDKTGLARRAKEVASRIEREPDPLMARLAIARALTAEALDFSDFRSLPLREAVDDVARIGDRLELGQRIAVDVLRVEPANWEAAMVLGSARYLGLSRTGDARFFNDRPYWERPLSLAVTLAPQYDEPMRVLSGARLEIWPTLTGDEQHQTRELLHRAFADPPTFTRLAAIWLEAAGSRDAAFGLIPRTSAAWALVEDLYGQRREWDSLIAARERFRTALAAELQRGAVEFNEQLRGGNIAVARSLALALVAKAPPDGRFRQLVEDLLGRCPPLSVVGEGEAAFLRWLRWSNDRYLREHDPLSALVILRMIEGLHDTVPAAEAAVAVLSTGNLAAAERWEHRSEALNTEEWAPYCLAKARVLAGRGDVGDAAAFLVKANRSWRGSPPELMTRLAVLDASADTSAQLAAREEERAVAARAWPATAWRWRAGRARLDLLAAVPASTLSITWDVAPDEGGVVEVRLDGTAVATEKVHKGATTTIAAQVSADAHLLDVEPVAGGKVAPGSVVLGDQAGSSSR